MFSGMSNHSVDAKGRIVLPAKFREELGESFYIARGFGNPCIQAMSKEQFDVLSSRIMELPADKAMALQYSFTATAVEVAPNASGRVMLPQALREFAKIEGDASKVKVVWQVENKEDEWKTIAKGAHMMLNATAGALSKNYRVALLNAAGQVVAESAVETAWKGVTAP